MSFKTMVSPAASNVTDRVTAVVPLLATSTLAHLTQEDVTATVDKFLMKRADKRRGGAAAASPAKKKSPSLPAKTTTTKPNTAKNLLVRHGLGKGNLVYDAIMKPTTRKTVAAAASSSTGSVASSPASSRNKTTPPPAANKKPNSIPKNNNSPPPLTKPSPPPSNRSAKSKIRHKEEEEEEDVEAEEDENEDEEEAKHQARHQEQQQHQERKFHYTPSPPPRARSSPPPRTRSSEDEEAEEEEEVAKRPSPQRRRQQQQQSKKKLNSFESYMQGVSNAALQRTADQEFRRDQHSSSSSFDPKREPSNSHYEYYKDRTRGEEHSSSSSRDIGKDYHFRVEEENQTPEIRKEKAILCDVLNTQFPQDDPANKYTINMLLCDLRAISIVKTDTMQAKRKMDSYKAVIVFVFEILQHILTHFKIMKLKDDKFSVSQEIAEIIESGKCDQDLAEFTKYGKKKPMNPFLGLACTLGIPLISYHFNGPKKQHTRSSTRRKQKKKTNNNRKKKSSKEEEDEEESSSDMEMPDEDEPLSRPEKRGGGGGGINILSGLSGLAGIFTK